MAFNLLCMLSVTEVDKQVTNTTLYACTAAAYFAALNIANYTIAFKYFEVAKRLPFILGRQEVPVALE